MTQQEISFDGPDISREHDQPRLNRLHDAVLALMRDEQYRTYAEIRTAIGRGSEGGIAARLRDYRKPRLGGYLPGRGGYIVEKRRRGESKDGLWEFRVRHLGPGAADE